MENILIIILCVFAICGFLYYFVKGCLSNKSINQAEVVFFRFLIASYFLQILVNGLGLLKRFGW